MIDKEDRQIAIILPAYNEAESIQSVIEDFHKELPKAEIYVVDNNSTDDTAVIAKKTLEKLTCSGKVLHEERQGKAFAMRTAFGEIEADIYIMADADGTYDPKDLEELLEPIITGERDIVVGERFTRGSYSQATRRRFHSFGNALVCTLVNLFFKGRLTDIMSGYRAMTREFIVLCPLVYDGFEIETEMTIHALDKRFRIAEVPVNYKTRPPGNPSKLNTYRDGFKILLLIGLLFKRYRPLLFFGVLSVCSILVSLLFGGTVIKEFMDTGVIHRIPSAILASSVGVLGMVFLGFGLLLDSISWNMKLEYELAKKRYRSRC